MVSRNAQAGVITALIAAGCSGGVNEAERVRDLVRGIERYVDDHSTVMFVDKQNADKQTSDVVRTLIGNHRNEREIGYKERLEEIQKDYAALSVSGRTAVDRQLQGLMEGEFAKKPYRSDEIKLVQQALAKVPAPSADLPR
ncbi:MAG: hypothetical protein SFW63_05745 [Alphaproteobacteria bacterium]|nr:hypothetical protein [Alphaproteobacteria bacterium]